MASPKRRRETLLSSAWFNFCFGCCLEPETSGFKDGKWSMLKRFSSFSVGTLQAPLHYVKQRNPATVFSLQTLLIKPKIRQ